MADQKLSQLPAVANVTLADLVYLVQAGSSSQCTVTQLLAAITAAIIEAALGFSDFARTGAANTFTAGPQVFDANTLYIDFTNHRVGVGTTPSYTFHIVDGSYVFALSGTSGFSSNLSSVGQGWANFGTNSSATDILDCYSSRTVSNATLVLRVDGSGHVISLLTGANAILLNSTGTNYGTIQQDAADTWSLGTATTPGTLGTPVLQWTKAGLVTTALKNSTTSAVDTAVQVRHNSTGTPAAGFGAAVLFQLDSSTTANRPAAEEQAAWATATDAARKGRLSLGAHDFATSAGSPREGVRVESDGTQALLGFYGVAAIARAALATGAGHTVDDVITALQNLGLVKQS